MPEIRPCLSQYVEAIDDGLIDPLDLYKQRLSYHHGEAVNSTVSPKMAPGS